MGIADHRNSIPIAQWPEMDRRAWTAAHTAGGYFDKDGLATNWSLATTARCEKEYGRLLLYQMRCGTLRNVRRVGERVERQDDLRDFIDWLRSDLAPLSVVAALGHIAQAVRALDPSFDRELLNRARRRLSATARPARKIDDQLLSPRELWELGMSMIEEAVTSEHLSEKPRAILYRDGLLIAFLSICPLRRRNAINLRENHHLEIEAGSRELAIPANEMKTRSRDFQTALPTQLVSRLHQFWTDFRPALAWRPGTDDTALWLTMRGTQMKADTLSDRIERILLERKGRRFSSHMFRHSAATFLADVAPQLAMLAVGVLGHAHLQTANDHYIRGQQKMALHKFQEEVIAIIERAGGLIDD